MVKLPRIKIEYVGIMRDRVWLFLIINDRRLGWKKSHLLSERLAALGIMGTQLRAPLVPHDTIECCDGVRGSRGCREPLVSRTDIHSVAFPCLDGLPLFTINETI